jgi:integrase
MLEEFISIAYKRSKYSAKQNFNNLRSRFNKAISWGYIETNPFKKISIPKIPYNNPRFLNESEFRLILSNEPNELFKDIYLFAFHTGMRLSEIVSVSGIRFH